jgi:tetratricopeptide (TPR) repeat protein
MGRGTIQRTGRTQEALGDLTAVQLNPITLRPITTADWFISNRANINLRSTNSRRRSPSNNAAEPNLARGMSYLALNDLKSAVDDFTDAGERDPRNAEAWMQRGLVFEKMGNKDSAASTRAR